MATYKEIRQMWDDLGMDLEAHDVFVNSFPEVLREVILSQENRPEHMEYFTGVVKRVHGARPYELYEHKKKGGKVFGTYCVYVPDEIIFALGAISTGLCGGDQFWVPGGAKVLPANTCALIQSSLGSRLDRTSPFCQVADMFIGENTCDGKKKAWEILSRDVPMHIIDIPQMKRVQDIAKFEEEIKIFIEVVEKVTGNKLDEDKLSKGIKLINDKRRALKRITEARKSNPSPISGRDALIVTQVAFYDDPIRFTTNANILAEELEKRINEGEGISKEAPRILMAGTPMALPNWKLHHIVESLGGVVVIEESCTGTRYFENLVDESQSTLEGQVKALAERYMKTNCACFTPNQGRIEDIIRMVREWQVDGVIDYNLQFCGLYSTESYLVKEALKEEGIPVLHIETDYSNQDIGQLRTRIEAFLEMVSK